MVFWKGSSTPVDERSPELINLPNNFIEVFKASIWGISFPGGLVASTILGIGLMFAPAAFGVDIETSAADISHLSGALIVVTSVVSMAEVIRVVRFANLLFGVAVAGLLWITPDSTTALNFAGLFAGLLVVLFSISRGRIL